MKNKFGMKRSAEFMKANAPTQEEKAVKKETEGEAPSKLHHMRVYPADKDGVVEVTHHASENAEPHETHAFEENEDEKMVNHLMEHSGMPFDSEGGGDHYADESKTATA